MLEMCFVGCDYLLLLMLLLSSGFICSRKSFVLLLRDPFVLELPPLAAKCTRCNEWHAIPDLSFGVCIRGTHVILIFTMFLRFTLTLR